MAEDGADGLDERRRLGLEMQAQLPRPRHQPKDHPVVHRAEAVGEVAAGGCMLADLGPFGLLIGALTTVVLFLRKRRRAEAD